VYCYTEADMKKSTPAPDLSPALREQVRGIIGRHLGQRRYRLYLFGSRARGDATSRSDYDFGVQADGPLELATLARIRADLEDLPVLQRIDVVDLTAATPEFVHRALEHSQVLDER